MRVVLDVNVVISALLSPSGAPAQVLRAWLLGAYDLVVSPRLLGELERALAYPKLRRRIGQADAEELVALLRVGAVVLPDPDGPPSVHSLKAISATRSGLT